MAAENDENDKKKHHGDTRRCEGARFVCAYVLVFLAWIWSPVVGARQSRAKVTFALTNCYYQSASVCDAGPTDGTQNGGFAPLYYLSLYLVKPSVLGFKVDESRNTLTADCGRSANFSLL